jgi:hypothetical protein
VCLVVRSCLAKEDDCDKRWLQVVGPSLECERRDQMLIFGTTVSTTTRVTRVGVQPQEIMVFLVESFSLLCRRATVRSRLYSNKQWPTGPTVR